MRTYTILLSLTFISSNVSSAYRGHINTTDTFLIYVQRSGNWCLWASKKSCVAALVGCASVFCNLYIIPHTPMTRCCAATSCLTAACSTIAACCCSVVGANCSDDAGLVIKHRAAQQAVRRKYGITHGAV